MNGREYLLIEQLKQENERLKKELAEIKFAPDGSADFNKMTPLQQWIERYNFMRVRGDAALHRAYKSERELAEARRVIAEMRNHPLQTVYLAEQYFAAHPKDRDDTEV